MGYLPTYITEIINLIIVVLISFRLLCPIIIEAETSSEITPTEVYNQRLVLFNEEGLYDNQLLSVKTESLS